MSTLGALEEQVKGLAARIEAPDTALPTFGRSEQSGLPHLEVTSDGIMHWVVCERGAEFERRSTVNRDQLFYWTFQSVTFSMAMAWERDHRIKGEDFRKQLWTRQFELLGKLNPDWVERRKAELGPLLREAGFMAPRSWPVIYKVTLSPVTGEPKSYNVLTWLGTEKAIAVAVSADGRGYGNDLGIYDVFVTERGLAPRAEDGTVDVAGFLTDRMEF